MKNKINSIFLGLGLFLLIYPSPAGAQNKVRDKDTFQQRSSALDRIQKMLSGKDELDETLKKMNTMKSEFEAQQINVDESTAEILKTLKNPFIPQLPQEPVTVETVPVPPSQIGGPPVSTGDQPPAPPAPPPDFRINGLVWNTTRPQAIIDGTVVSVGDDISNWHVDKISSEGIVMSFQNQRLTIKPGRMGKPPERIVETIAPAPVTATP